MFTGSRCQQEEKSLQIQIYNIYKNILQIMFSAPLRLKMRMCKIHGLKFEGRNRVAHSHRKHSKVHFCGLVMCASPWWPLEEGVVNISRAYCGITASLQRPARGRHGSRLACLPAWHKTSSALSLRGEDLILTCREEDLKQRAGCCSSDWLEVWRD